MQTSTRPSALAIDGFALCFHELVTAPHDKAQVAPPPDHACVAVYASGEIGPRAIAPGNLHRSLRRPPEVSASEKIRLPGQRHSLGQEAGLNPVIDAERFHV